MNDTPEKRAVISGIGISRVGRRTGMPGIELTTEACAAAIADAGVTSSDIYGMATIGDTLMRETRAALGMSDPRYLGGGFDTAGLLSPVTGAAVTVGSGRARHVLVYRTVPMMGGEYNAGAGREPDPESPPSGSASSVMGGIDTLLAHYPYSAANWLAMHCQRHMPCTAPPRSSSAGWP